MTDPQWPRPPPNCRLEGHTCLLALGRYWGHMSCTPLSESFWPGLKIIVSSPRGQELPPPAASCASAILLQRGLWPRGWLREGREQAAVCPEEALGGRTRALQPEEFQSRVYGVGTPAWGHTQDNRRAHHLIGYPSWEWGGREAPGPPDKPHSLLGCRTLVGGGLHWPMWPQRQGLTTASARLSKAAIVTRPQSKTSSLQLRQAWPPVALVLSPWVGRGASLC